MAKFPTEKIENGPKSLTCGLVMPISPIDGCTSEHWSDVKAIIVEAVENISPEKFSTKMVSDADDVGVIQKRIVHNVYNSDIIICDVSGKNPNVMFELGLRLAFDKPTVIIKDDKTDYSFDTGIIEHVPYPRDLRFHKIVSFKALLAQKVLATYNAAESDPKHSTFLKNFGQFSVANLNENSVPAEKFIAESLNDIQEQLSQLRISTSISSDSLRRTRTDKNSAKEIEGAARIGVEVTKYLSGKSPSDVSSLTDSEEFVQEMVDNCNGPEYFSSPKRFKEVLERVVREIGMSNEAG